MALTAAQLRALVAVERHGSFSAAADALRVSQPAVSGAVKALEVEVGGPVLDRRSGRLTDLGSAVLPHALAALGSLDAVVAAAAEHRGAPHGTVRLAVVPSVRAGLVPRLLQTWARQLPAVTVEVLEGDDPELPDWLDAGLADAAVLVDPDDRDLGPGAVELPGDLLRAVVPADHPLAARASVQASVHLEELVAERLLSSGGGCQVQLRALHRDVGLPFRPVAEVAGLPSLLAMVARGDGVAVVPELAAPLVPRGARLVALEPELRRRLVLTGPPPGGGREQHRLVGALLAAAAVEGAGLA